MSLSNRSGVTLVTGCNGPIGQAICSSLKESGHIVLGLDLKSPTSGAELAEFYQCDFQDLESLAEVVARLTRRYPIRNLVNNAAITPEQLKVGFNSPLKDQSTDAFLAATAVNLVAPFLLTRDLFYRQTMGELQAVVNIGSTYGIVGPSVEIYAGTQIYNSAAYAATKAGLSQLTRYFAVMLAPSCRVNTVAPGGIQRNQDLRFIKAYIEKTPLARMNTEIDVASAVRFLLSPESAYITGQTLAVDGGWTAR